MQISIFLKSAELQNLIIGTAVQITYCLFQLSNGVTKVERLSPPPQSACVSSPRMVVGAPSIYSRPNMYPASYPPPPQAGPPASCLPPHPAAVPPAVAVASSSPAPPPSYHHPPLYAPYNTTPYLPPAPTTHQPPQPPHQAHPSHSAAHPPVPHQTHQPHQSPHQPPHPPPHQVMYCLLLIWLIQSVEIAMLTTLLKFYWYSEISSTFMCTFYFSYLIIFINKSKKYSHLNIVLDLHSRLTKIRSCSSVLNHQLYFSKRINNSVMNCLFLRISFKSICWTKSSWTTCTEKSIKVPRLN